MDQATVNSYIEAAQRLMNDDRFNALVESKAAGAFGSKASSGGKRGTKDPTLAAFEAQAGFSSGKQAIYEQTSVQPKKNGIPQEIQESFKKMPSPSAGLSVMTPPASYYGTQQAQPTYTQMPQSNGVDYTIIKAIVNECLRENMKSMLNENVNGTLSGLKMVGGNRIQFIDSKGNIYEGVLKRVK